MDDVNGSGKFSPAYLFSPLSPFLQSFSTVFPIFSPSLILKIVIYLS